MNADLPAQKALLRHQIRARVARLSPDDRREASRLLRERLVQQAVWLEARSVLLFASLPDEPDVWPLCQAALDAGKVLALPRFDPAAGQYTAARVHHPDPECPPGRFGIREPGPGCGHLELKQLDLILVPGVGFDPSGHRLGRGKGYYDRLLAGATAVTCGVAWEEQCVAAIPVAAHDAMMHYIVTPACWLDCQAKRPQLT